MASFTALEGLVSANSRWQIISDQVLHDIVYIRDYNSLAFLPPRQV